MAAGPESRAASAGRLDLPGAALLAAGLVAIVLPLADGRQQGWPAWSWACLALGPVLLALFAGYLRRAAGTAGSRCSTRPSSPSARCGSA